VKKVFIIDDEADQVLLLTAALQRLGLSVSGTSKIDTALKEIEDNNPAVVVADLSLDKTLGPNSGLSLISEIRKINSSLRIIVLTGHATNEYGIEAIKRGAQSFIAKPANPEHLKVLIEDAFINYDLREDLKKAKSRAPIPNSLKQEIEFAKTSDQPVLLTGETGTGKSWIAKMIHNGRGPFVSYQPILGTGELMYSELFGALKGSFTGAIQDRAGLVAAANGGTLFLDEIGELPVTLQVTLLGVLQEKTFRPLGSIEERKSNFRLISATNVEIETKIEKGEFRPDLFHRINHIHIHVPPLRARTDEIVPLANYFLDRIAEKNSCSSLELSPGAIKALKAHTWPGNIRELEAVIERGVYKALFVDSFVVDESLLGLKDSPSEARSFAEKVEKFKIALIEDALSRSGGNQAEAARLLQLDRSSMRRMLARKGLLG
jgi:two-component system NtrC family response regulator